MKSVAIFGFDAKTRDEIHNSKAGEVWTLNDAYNHGVPMERVTRWYEMHKMSYLITKDASYKDFLRKRHPFPIYMQEAARTVFDWLSSKRMYLPSSVTYPRDKISRAIDGGSMYFTSTMAYMIAHAIFENYNQIELYGIDLSYGTEYEFQKACVEYYLGIARGRGIRVIVPEESGLLSAPMYGYDMHGASVTVDAIDKHQQHYREMYDKSDGDIQVVYDGAQALISVLKKRFVYDGHVDKHTLEIRDANLLNHLMKVNSEYNFACGQINILEEGTMDIDEIKVRQLDLYDKMLQIDGALQATRNVLGMLNGKAVNLELRSSFEQSFDT